MKRSNTNESISSTYINAKQIFIFRQHKKKRMHKHGCVFLLNSNIVQNAVFRHLKNSVHLTHGFLHFGPFFCIQQHVYACQFKKKRHLSTVIQGKFK